MGREILDDTIPLEADLWDAVSFSKGCYIGQEIIARLESRGRMAKQLTGVRLDTQAAPPLDLLQAGHRVGRLTSVGHSPDLGWIGLALVKPAALESDGGQVQVGDQVAKGQPGSPSLRDRDRLRPFRTNRPPTTHSLAIIGTCRFRTKILFVCTGEHRSQPPGGSPLPPARRSAWPGWSLPGRLRRHIELSCRPDARRPHASDSCFAGSGILGQRPPGDSCVTSRNST